MSKKIMPLLFGAASFLGSFVVSCFLLRKRTGSSYTELCEDNSGTFIL